MTNADRHPQDILGDAWEWRCRMALSSIFNETNGGFFSGIASAMTDFSGGKMSDAFKEQMKKKFTASNDPKPTHCVELSVQELFLTDEFGKARDRIMDRFQKYQEDIGNFRKNTQIRRCNVDGF